MTMSETPVKSTIKRVAIVGAGASGIVAAKSDPHSRPCQWLISIRYLEAEGCFEAVDVYEQRGEPGGIWLYTPQAAGDGLFHVPQTEDAPVPAELPIQIRGDGEDGGAVFLSPVYDGLEVNIPHPLMRFSDLEFPPDLPLFPGHEEVARYLRRYAEGVRHLIRFNTQVVELAPRSSGQDRWELTAKNLVTGAVTRERYDAVALAHGHYTTPYVPAIPGLAEWHARHPGTVNHARYHRDPAREYGGTRTVIVGAAVSGLDIARRLAPPVCAALFLAGAEEPPPRSGAGEGPEPSVHDDDVNAPTSLAPVPHGITPLPRLAAVDAQARSVTCEGGRRIANVDRILLATGYLYTLPFLPAASLVGPHGAKLLRPGRGMGGVDARARLFCAADASLALLACHQRVIPFPLAEAQACLLARVWAGRVVALPAPQPTSVSVVRETVAGADGERVEKKEEEEEEEDRRWLVLGYPRDAEYMAFLLRWAASAGPGAGKAVPPGWGPRERWIREMIPAIRREWMRRGEERSKVRTMEELGFEFKGGEGE
jgi:hypothetical protein